ncbi:ESCO1 family protein [Megaselia abdita]
MEETPKSRYSHLQRLPTPRLMSRRKSLFMEIESSESPKSTSSTHIDSIAEDGIGFLEDNDTSVEEVLQNMSCLHAGNTPRYENPPQMELSMATPLQRTSSIDQELPNLLNSMSLKKSKKEKENKENIISAKRHMNFSPRRDEPALKLAKKENKVSPIETKNFYSATPKIDKPKLRPLLPTKVPKIKRRRRTISRASAKTHLKPTSIENILKTINSDKLKNKILAHREQKQKLAVVHQILMNSQNPIAMAVPLNVNRDRDKDVTCDFSDVEECDINEVEVEFIDEFCEMPGEEDEVQETGENKEEEEEEIFEEKVGSKRKFFKSKDRSKKMIKLEGKMTAEITGTGKMTLKTPDVKHSFKKRRIKTSVPMFEAEQLAVDNIIQNLNTTAEPPFIPFRDRIPYKTNEPETVNKQLIFLDFLEANNICTEENFTIFIAEPDKYADRANEIISQISSELEIEDANEFRSRIPYNTTDPQMIEQQRTLLEFLISNNICSNENFDIFIADYDNRKSEAEEIMNQFIVSDSSDLVSEASSRVCDGDQVVQDVQPTEDQQKLYPLFYPDKAKELYKKLNFTTTRRNRQFNGGFGANQYQIDAGQKEFGAKQCKECGLIYTVHEPEEEKLHKEYHNNLYVLRFKGWIDEVVVDRFPKWSPDGRIIKLTSNDPIRRIERVHEVLRVVVDKELGFSSYILPDYYVVFLAISKNKIIGLCLVQPLDKAYKYLCINGVDCCSLESYDVSCGISRIWISPFHRRLHVGKNLIKAVQSSSFQKTLSMDEIAFSAPTEDGKKFARSVSQKDDFFVYQ